MFYLYSFGSYVDFSFFPLFQAWKYIHLPLSVTARKKSELSDRCQPIFRTVLHLARSIPNRFEDSNRTECWKNYSGTEKFPSLFHPRDRKTSVTFLISYGKTFFKHPCDFIRKYFEKRTILFRRLLTKINKFQPILTSFNQFWQASTTLTNFDKFVLILMTLIKV